MGKVVRLWKKVDKRWMGIALALAFVLFSMQELRIFDLADAYWLKACFMARRALQFEHPKESPIVLVTVDSPSIRKLGRWPWKRSVWGDITQKLEKGGARVIGYDIDFSTPGPDDDLFAAHLRKNVLLPLWFEYVEQGKVGVTTPPIRAGFPSPPLFSKSRQGFVNIETGTLGTRRGLLEATYRDRLYPSFPLQAYLMYRRIPFPVLTGTGRRINGPDFSVPVDGDGALWINYKRENFQTVPAEALLDPKFPDKKMFKGKIVLVGVTSPLGNDIRVTPYGSMSGLELQAQILRSLLDQDFIAPMNPWIALPLLAALGLALGGLLPLYPWRRFLPWIGVSLFLVLFCGFWAFQGFGVVVDVFPPILLILAMTGCVVLLESYGTEETLQTRVEELKAINQMSHLHTGNMSLEELLTASIEMIQEVMQVRTLGILLKDETGRLVMNIARGSACDQTERVMNENEGICGRAARTGKAILVNDPASNPYAAKFERNLDVSAFLAVPLVAQGEASGVLWVASDDAAFNREAQIRLITMSNQLAVGVRNCHLSRSISRLYLDAIRALLRAVEYYQPSGKGHSERVASYAMMMAGSAALPADEIETIRSAALLHDVGRMGHFESMYRKPEGLTDADWKQIFNPLKAGLLILEPLSGQFPILPILYHFYERYDGKGFPDALQGERIPIGARILAIANAFDDISANGPQLGQVSLERAIHELKKEAGTLFDPDLVRQFVNTVSHIPAEEFLRGMKQAV